MGCRLKPLYFLISLSQKNIISQVFGLSLMHIYGGISNEYALLCALYTLMALGFFAPR